MSLRFEWDEAKNKANRKKHGIWFETAKTAFDDPYGRLLVEDSGAEDRFILIGSSSDFSILIIVHLYKKTMNQFASYPRGGPQEMRGNFMKKEYNLSKMKEVKNSYPKKKKKLVGINLSPEVIDYFKKLSDDSGIPYQKLIDLYLLDCVKSKKKLSLKWTA